MMSDETDVQVVEQTTHTEEDAKLTMIAKYAAQILSKAYANHWWMIGWAPGGVLVIKHGAGDGRYGYSIDVFRMASLVELEKEVMRGGGELLERMNMPRRAWDGETMPTMYDGMEEHGPNRIH
tara:strand:- start:1248 stop:1616 length:369 start_codon:yes stop_codon:yes gene_type:complete